ncbi:MAG: hypothetical protein EBR34_14630 [Sphingomonadaceae bacterium]|jgi:hypothetical protein|nr:hypothetical protein [Sphingomonadaceae bacterium]
MSGYFDEADRFVMVHQAQDLEGLLAALARRDLQHRDISVLLAMISRMDRTGKVRVTALALAEQLEMAHTVCIGSISRLRKHAVLVKVYDRQSGSHYFILNPYVASIGGPQTRGHLWAQFKAALEDAG